VLYLTDGPNASAPGTNFRPGGGGAAPAGRDTIVPGVAPGLTRRAPMSQPAPRSALLLLGAGSCLAALALHAYALAHPALVGDDFQILVRSRTWSAARDNLWLSHNEHAMPLGRLTTWALVALAGRAENLPWVCAWQGPLAVLLGMPLLYRFVRRELGHPFYGLVAMTVFGVSSVYQQAVLWFSSSFSILSLDMALLALLAAQDWRRTGRVWHLVLSGFWAALAPAWFAIGILAGPLACLYLLPPERGAGRGAPGGKPAPRAPRLALHLAAALAPLLGSAAFLAVSLPRTAERIMHLDHYQGETAVQAFHPLTGLLYTCRSLVDNLYLGEFGLGTGPGVVYPLPVALVMLAVLVLFGVWWWWRAPDRRLLVLGLGFILANYLLVYGARSTWPWDARPWMHTWTRYHLFPQLGLALFVCGGLPRWQGRLWRLDPAGVLSWRQAGGLGLLLAVLFLVHLPRGVIGARYWDSDSAEQRQVLRQVDEMDARCRRLHIDRETALQALPFLELPSSWKLVSGWELLRGSPDPAPVTVEEARRLLEGPGEGTQGRAAGFIPAGTSPAARP
jgi:hypothetical protein